MDKEVEGFLNIALPIINNEKYKHHGTTSIYRHAILVAFIAYRKAVKKKNVNLEDLVTGALLHDLYFYDWHEPNSHKRPHGYTHPREAMENAIKYFNVNKHVQHIIRTHMWPLTLFHMPLTKEARMVSHADKKATLYEIIKLRRFMRKKNKLLKK